MKKSFVLFCIFLATISYFMREEAVDSKIDVSNVSYKRDGIFSNASALVTNRSGEPSMVIAALDEIFSGGFGGGASRKQCARRIYKMLPEQSCVVLLNCAFVEGRLELTVDRVGLKTDFTNPFTEHACTPSRGQEVR